MSFYLFKAEKVQSIVPYYYFPTIKNLQKESLSIAEYAHQLLYFGQYKQALNLAKLAVKINNVAKNVPKICIKLCAAGIFGCRISICSI